MGIKEITYEEVLHRASTYLQVPNVSPNEISDSFIAAALRRQASFQCPCSPTTLVNALLDTLLPATGSDDTIKKRVEGLIEQLVVVGDLLELRHVTTFEDGVKGTWIFPAPLRFVQHPHENRLYILGISRAEYDDLFGHYDKRLNQESGLRSISYSAEENLPEILGSHGIAEVSMDTWLKFPKDMTAHDHLEKMQSKLNALASTVITSDIKIFDQNSISQSYSKRWVKPTSQTGRFISRRPQQYGADLWGYAYLEHGQCKKFLDLPLNSSSFRGCDAAWRLQLAIDAVNNAHQKFGYQSIDGRVTLKFYSPLPLWARRRLEALASKYERDDCLIAFILEEVSAMEEMRILEEKLWFKPAKES